MAKKTQKSQASNNTVIPLDQIKPYWRNPRDNKAAVEVVAQSIREFGFNQPLVVDRDNVIIAGHTRYQALLQLGYAEAECKVVDLTPEKAKAYRIADNKASEFSEWDDEKLFAELRELPDFSEMQKYFDEDLSSLLEEATGVSDQVIGQMAPTEQVIQEAAEQHTESMHQASESKTGGKIEVICPHCLQTFHLEQQYLDNDHKWHPVDDSAKAETPVA